VIERVVANDGPGANRKRSVEKRAMPGAVQPGVREPAIHAHLPDSLRRRERGRAVLGVGFRALIEPVGGQHVRTVTRMAQRPHATSTSGCCAKISPTFVNAPGRNVSSEFSHPNTSPRASAKPLLMACDWPRSRSDTQEARRGAYLRMISTLPSVDPPSMTMSS